MAGGSGSGPWASGIRGFIGELLEQGLNATQGYEAAAAAGIERPSTQAWYDIWGETAAAKANAGRFFDVDYNARLGADMYTPWAAGRAGQYAHQVGVVVRDLESGVEYTVNYTAVSDYAMTPQEAVDEAMDVFTRGTTAEGGTFEERIRGAFLVGAYEMTGRRR